MAEETPGKNIEFPQLPFPTREMLKFGNASTLSLRIRSRSTGANDITLRGITREGIFGFNHTTLGIGGTFTQSFRIPDIPISLIVQSNSSTREQGEIFVEVTLLINGDPVAVLCAGYLYGIHSIGFPGPNTPDSRPGGGVISVIESADPAAGAELSDTVNGNELWRLQSIRFQLVADANVANRTVHLVITDGTNNLFDIIATTAVTADQTRDMSWVTVGEISDAQSGGNIITELPINLLLPNPFRITTVTENLQAGDNFGVMRILVERWLV